MEALARAIEAGPYAHTIVASQHAAIYLADVDRSQLGEIWAVGPATRDVLAKFSPRVASVHDAEGLAKELIGSREVAGAKILVPRAEHGRTAAIDLLREAGAELTDVIAYRTRSIAADDPIISAGREILAGCGAAVCCVFAPSQVAALIEIMGPLPEIPTQFCAIGETTAAALHAAGVACTVAPLPTPAGLAEAVRAMLATLPPA